jgi:hypothetical protein
VALMSALSPHAYGFINRIRSLHCLDKYAVPFLTSGEWVQFRDDPIKFLVRANDETADRICAAVEARQSTPANPAQGVSEADLLERLAEAEAIIADRNDELALIDWISDKIGLPHDEELTRENFTQYLTAAIGAGGQAVAEDGAMTPEEIRLENLKQMAHYDGPIVSFEVKEPYYLASCDHCGWVGSSERCGTDSFGDDSDVYCPRCHASGADCGKVASALTHPAPSGQAVAIKGGPDEVEWIKFVDRGTKLYTHPAPSGQAVVVKALEWQTDGETWWVRGNAPRYEVGPQMAWGCRLRFGTAVLGSPTGDWFISQAAAIAAAQKDHEKRVLSCLLTTPAGGSDA